MAAHLDCPAEEEGASFLGGEGFIKDSNLEGEVDTFSHEDDELCKIRNRFAGRLFYRFSWETCMGP